MESSEINIDTLDRYLKHKFLKLFPEFIYEGYGDFESNQVDILYEIENYGLTKIEHLVNIIPSDYTDVVSNLKIKLNYLGTLRVLLILHDHEKYIRNYNEFSYRNFWEISNLESIEPLFNSYGISLDKIIRETKEKET